MKKLSILTLVVAFMLVFSVNKSEALFDVGVKYWFSELDSELQVTEAAILGDTIDLTKEIGLPSKENFLEFRVVAGLGSHKLRYIFLPM
ncbi:MAG: hypothetical protein KAR06_02565, partial [Deltaproteobacteria bacterium]|nr:hypothetical protein [Deltaproteobacteria bacterium]